MIPTLTRFLSLTYWDGMSVEPNQVMHRGEVRYDNEPDFFQKVYNKNIDHEIEIEHPSHLLVINHSEHPIMVDGTKLTIEPHDFLYCTVKPGKMLLLLHINIKTRFEVVIVAKEPE